VESFFHIDKTKDLYKDMHDCDTYIKNLKFGKVISIISIVLAILSFIIGIIAIISLFYI